MALRKISITIYEPTKNDVDRVLGISRNMVQDDSSRKLMDHTIAVFTSDTDENNVQLDIVANRYPF